MYFILNRIFFLNLWKLPSPPFIRMEYNKITFMYSKASLRKTYKDF